MSSPNTCNLQERSAWNRIGAPDPLLNMEEGVDSSAGTKWISHSKIQKSIFKQTSYWYIFIHCLLGLSWHLRFPPQSKWWISGGQMISNRQTIVTSLPFSLTRFYASAFCRSWSVDKFVAQANNSILFHMWCVGCHDLYQARGRWDCRRGEPDSTRQAAACQGAGRFSAASCIFPFFHLTDILTKQHGHENVFLQSKGQRPVVLGGHSQRCGRFKFQNCCSTVLVIFSVSPMQAGIRPTGHHHKRLA